MSVEACPSTADITGGRSCPCSAAAPGAPGNSPKPSTYCSSARPNQVGKGSVVVIIPQFVEGLGLGAELYARVALGPIPVVVPVPDQSPLQDAQRGGGITAVRGDVAPRRRTHPRSMSTPADILRRQRQQAARSLTAAGVLGLTSFLFP